MGSAFFLHYNNHLITFMTKIQAISKNKAKSSPYYNIGQLRVDYWNKLKIETSELARCHSGSANEKKHKQLAKALIADLGGVECFFATPGKRRMQKLEKAPNNWSATITGAIQIMWILMNTA
jgi:hypothetical protein